MMLRVHPVAEEDAVLVSWADVTGDISEVINCVSNTNMH